MNKNVKYAIIIIFICACIATFNFVGKKTYEKTYEKDLERFLEFLPNPSHWSTLPEEDRNLLRRKAEDFYSEYTTENFGNVERNWSDRDYEKFIREYVDFGDDAYGRYVNQGK